MKNKIAKIIISFLVVMGVLFITGIIGYLLHISDLARIIMIVFAFGILTLLTYDLLFNEK